MASSASLLAVSVVYTFTYSDSSRLEEVTPEPDESEDDSESDEEAEPPEPEYITVWTRTYAISYNGEAYSCTLISRRDDADDIDDNSSPSGKK